MVSMGVGAAVGDRGAAASGGGFIKSYGIIGVFGVGVTGDGFNVECTWDEGVDELVWDVRKCDGSGDDGGNGGQ